MKNNIIKAFSVIGLFLFVLNAYSQNTQDQALVVPLSNPGEDGSLKVSLLYGSIEVTSHQGKDVIIESTLSIKKKQKEQFKNGMRKISNNSSQFSVEEYNNAVIIKSKVGNNTRDFRIKVPKNFSLDLRTVNNGNISVQGVHGEMEISNTNGAVTLTNVAGSVIADALNKDIVVSFTEVTANAAMAFTSLNGDLDISFPKSLKANIKARTEYGDIFTDFDVKQEQPSKKLDKSNTSGVYKVTIDKWVAGAINGGGAEILFKTLNGDILIRAN